MFTIELQDVLLKTLPKTVPSLELNMGPKGMDTTFSDGVGVIGRVQFITELPDIESNSLPIGNTQALMNMIGIMGEEIKLKVIKSHQGEPIDLNISNSEMKASFVLADKRMIKPVKIKKIPDTIDFQISKETLKNIQNSNKAVTTKHFAIQKTLNSIEFIANYNPNVNMDTVSVTLTKDQEVFDKIEKGNYNFPLYFDFPSLLEIINANKDMEFCTIGLHEKMFLIKFTADDNMETFYILTPKTLI